jgi:hypothetical protein
MDSAPVFDSFNEALFTLRRHPHGHAGGGDLLYSSPVPAVNTGGDNDRVF